jgi:NIMA (never in mitosis gene a)-related kinase
VTDKRSWNLTKKAGAALLGNGSFGCVFAVRHELDKHEYALKVINMKKLRMERGMADNSEMLIEVRTLAKLQHGPYIARYFDAVEFPRPSKKKPIADFLIIRLELCKGGTLEEELESYRRKGERMPIAIVRKFLAQIAEAFRFMAEKKIVHRDFKLDNVCLSGPEGDCRVVDLGFAREYGESSSSENSKPGSSNTLFSPRGNKRYRSPENDGTTKVDHKDDMWALGLVLCELLSGQSAKDIMDGDFAEFIPKYKEKLIGWIRDVANIDEDLGGIAQGLLLQDPAKRFSAKQVIAELVSIRERTVTELPPPFLPVGWFEALLNVRVPPDLQTALLVRIRFVVSSVFSNNILLNLSNLT